MKCKPIQLLGLVIALVFANDSIAQDSIPKAFVYFAHKQDIHPAYLYGIAKQESGYNFKSGKKPWPWALNHKGQSYYFKTKSDAIKKIKSLVSKGQLSFDVGLTQVNYYWNKELVDSYGGPIAILDPYTNLDIGSRILKKRRTESKDWREAVGRYHLPYPKKKSEHKRVERYSANVIKYASRYL